MSVLSVSDVQEYLEEGSLIIEPFEFVKETPPATVDLHLSPTMISYDFPGNAYTIGFDLDESEGKVEVFDGKVCWLDPGQAKVFVLAEKLVLPPILAGIILPRSTLTRLGVELQPTYLNPGYSGTCPVLITNHAEFRVGIPFREGQGPRVAQVMFLRLSSPPHRAYGEHRDDKYHPDTGSPARFDKDIDLRELIRPYKEVLDRK